MKKTIGFTLIELLIVITIIMILAAFIIVSVNNARKQSRDSKRIADLANIQLALEMYKDSNGHYPGFAPNWSDPPAATLAPYLSPIPKDPNPNIPADQGYRIMGANPAGGYYLRARLEDIDDMPTGGPGAKLGSFCYCLWGGASGGAPVTSCSIAAPSSCN